MSEARSPPAGSPTPLPDLHFDAPVEARASVGENEKNARKRKQSAKQPRKEHCEDADGSLPDVAKFDVPTLSLQREHDFREI